MSFLGSSPLARGTLLVHNILGLLVGLIPARAGNTDRCLLHPVSVRAHPRSRGEHKSVYARIQITPGSSPLARGTHTVYQCHHARVGLIPARAGNTSSGSAPAKSSRAHPRSRGEHEQCGRFLDVSLGSSPLARGTHLLTWDFTPYISKIESLWNQSLHPEYTISSHY